VIGFALRALERLLGEHEFTIRTGLARGLKRRYGLGFKPRLSLTKEEKFLLGLDFWGRTVFDVGGYVGIYTLFFARAVGKDGMVVVFEPNPRSYEELVYNVGANGFTNVTTMHVGLGSRRERVDLFIDPVYPSRGTVLEEAGVEAERVAIDLFPLDALIAQEDLPSPDFVKIDVEGLEMEVLRGMAETMDRCGPDLFVEIHGEIPEGMIAMLVSRRYAIFHVERRERVNAHTRPFVPGEHVFCTRRG
jgi:FkbM family methyltransferase